MATTAARHIILLLFDDGSFDDGAGLTACYYVEGGGAGSIWHMQFRRYSYVVASEGSTHGNSAISHTGGEKSATTWRGLTPILFFNGAKPTVRGAR